VFIKRISGSTIGFTAMRIFVIDSNTVLTVSIGIVLLVTFVLLPYTFFSYT